jgi:DNA-binding HxlR family transcriptional regulator
VFHEVPPKVEYSLTDLGQRLNTALLPLGDWGDENMAGIARRRGVTPAPSHTP